MSYHSESYTDDIGSYPHGKQFERRTLAALINSQQRLPRTWITSEGTLIEMARMNNSHLRNTIQMLRRVSLKRLSVVVSTYEQGIEVPLIEMHDADERALAAWGEVYDELISEALFRSEGDLETWLAL